MSAMRMSEQNVTSAVKLSTGAKSELQRQKREQRVNNEKYFRVHPELRQMVSAFMSSLLVDKPDDVHLYAEQFFTNPELAHSLGLVGWSRPGSPPAELPPPVEEDEFGEDELNPALAGTTDMDTVDLENLLVGLFKEADEDGSGSLDHAEFAKIMATADLGLSAHEVQLLLAEVDEDDSGTISYVEFVPLAVETVQTMRLKQNYAELEADVTEELSEAAASIIGPPEAFAERISQASEKLGTGGMLSKAQLKAFLKSPAIGLAKEQANAAVLQVPFDGQGTVAAATLLASLYDTVIKVVADALAHQNLGAVGEMITRAFEMYDKGSTGSIDKKVARSTLLSVFPFMTRLQATAVLSDAPLDESGQVQWKTFLPKLTALVKAMGDPNAIRERAEMAVRAEFQPAELMSGVDKEQFEKEMEMVFAEADKDGNGVLDVHEFQRVLGSSSFGLKAQEIEYLRAEFDADGDADISIDEFKNIAFEVLIHIAREKAIMAEMDYGM